MPRSLPPEILDLTFDYLRDELATLKACCIVSKSWIPRIRRHLFAHVKFDTFRFAFESWMKAFPDPSSSPAHYVRTLTIIGINIVAAASTDVGRWIRAFHNVVHLNFDDVDARGLDGNWGNDGRVSFLPFHGVSPVIRSLRLDTISIQPSEIFGLVCSFPLLEDFALGTIHCERRVSKWIAPLTSPRLTGSLKLSSMVGGIDRTARRLFDFPNGLHFTEIVLECVDEADFKFATDLVSRCSDTLESLNVTDKLLLPATSFFDLSTTAKLKDLVFQCNQPNVQWITRALQTVESEVLQQISIRPDEYTFTDQIPATVYQEWWDLDRVLVQFRTSRSICPKVVYEVELDGNGGDDGIDWRDDALSLLPELTRRGLVDLVEYPSP